MSAVATGLSNYDLTPRLPTSDVGFERYGERERLSVIKTT
jgi:hypothetical protein